MDNDNTTGGAGAEGGEIQPDPRETQLREMQARLDRATKDADEARGLASALVQRYTSNEWQGGGDAPQRRPQDSEPESEPDFDSMSPRQMAAYFESRMRKSMAEMTSNMANVFRQRVQMDDARWHATERQRVEAELKQAGLGDLVPEIDRYLRESNVSQEVLAQPGVMRRAAAVVIGERVLNDKLSQATRAPQLASAGGGMHGASEPSISSEEVEWLGKRGIKMDKETWKRVGRNDSPVMDVLAERMGGAR